MIVKLSEIDLLKISKIQQILYNINKINFIVIVIITKLLFDKKNKFCNMPVVFLTFNLFIWQIKLRWHREILMVLV